MKGVSRGENIISIKENFLGITQEVWEETLEAYQNLSEWKLKSYLQWYPLNNIEANVRPFDEIEKGYFVLDKNVMRVSDNYLQKSNGTFRQSQLISPTLYLVLESICRVIFSKVDDKFNRENCFYAGNLKVNEVTYGNAYKEFTDQIDKIATLFPLYIKLDVSDFFRNINIDILFEFITSKVDDLDLFYLETYKRLLRFVGNGSFPIIENSVGLSFLATQIYLHDLDKRTRQYLEKDRRIKGFELIRYVDDIFIFIDVENCTIASEFMLDFLNFYRSELKAIDLYLNENKTKLNKSEMVKNDLSTLLYDVAIHEVIEDFPELVEMRYFQFLNELVSKSREGLISREQYFSILEAYLSFPESYYSGAEIYNYLIYQNSQCFKDEKIIKLLSSLVKREVYSYDIKRFTVAILNTKDGDLIRTFLNELFKIKTWFDNESYGAITYLINRNFRHKDLKNKLRKTVKDKNELLFHYFENYCFLNQANKSQDIDYFIDFSKKISMTPITMHLYFLYEFERKNTNVFNSHAYYKNFFDRFTAEMEYFLNRDKYGKKRKEAPYAAFYKVKQLQPIYEDVGGTFEVLKKIDDIRNANPINHASSELITGKFTESEVLESIKTMEKLLSRKIRSVSGSV